MLSNKSPFTAALLYLALAFGYLFSGQLLSGISAQSQVVAIWAPAGFALVGCYLWWWRFFPAVFIASALFNLGTHDSVTLSQLTTSLGIEIFLIAFGATLQAAVGSAILRNWLGNPLYLQSDSRAVAFIFGVGLLVNLISPNIGVYALSQFNPNYSVENHWSNVFYWWLGDSLGVLIVTPLLLSVIQFGINDQNTKVHTESQPPRLLVFSAALLLMISVTLTTWFFSQFSYSNGQELAKREVKVVENSLYRQLNHTMKLLSILSNFIQVNPQLNKKQYDNFVQKVINSQPAVKAMSFNRIVQWQDRVQYEKRLSQIYNKPIKIRGTPIAENDPLVVVELISPEPGNEAAVGFNVYSNPKRKSVLDLQSPSLTPVATPIIQLVQSDVTEPAYLLFMPVYSNSDNEDSQLVGFATSVVLVNKLLEQTFDKQRMVMFNYELFEQHNLSVFAGNTGQAIPSLAQQPDTHSLSFDLAGQKWQMSLQVNPEYLSHYESRLSVFLYMLQIILVAFIMMLILLMNSRHVVLNVKVNDRTKALAKAKNQSDKAYQAKSRFLANMSHEIRTPLNAVLGFSQLIKQTEDTSTIKSYVEKIEISSSNLLNIVNDILDISKIESNKLLLEHRLFDMHSLLERIGVMFERNEPNGKVDWVIDDQLPPQLYYLGDQIRIEQVLINLLSNAFKFTHQGQVKLTADLIDKGPETAMLRFSVSDTGIGIEKSLQANLFDAFNQADTSTSRRFGGTGLGLTISKELCQMMQGDIDLVSEKGKGSTFTINIQLATSDQPPETNDEQTLVSFPDLALLVAEDNAINQLVIQELLKTLDIIPDIVSDGEKAIQALKEKDYDIVLMDCQMPIMDGYEATRVLRQDPRFKHLPIIALTADVMPEDKLRALEVGFSDHIGKPIEVHKLSQCLQKHLQTDYSRAG